jgi:hypothetical protein
MPRLGVVFKAQRDLTVLSEEQDMKVIIEKYLVQGYRLGTPLETSLMDICKTLLALHRRVLSSHAGFSFLANNANELDNRQGYIQLKWLFRTLPQY